MCRTVFCVNWFGLLQTFCREGKTLGSEVHKSSTFYLKVTKSVLFFTTPLWFSSRFPCVGAWTVSSTRYFNAVTNVVLMSFIDLFDMVSLTTTSCMEFWFTCNFFISNQTIAIIGKLQWTIRAFFYVCTRSVARFDARLHWFAKPERLRRIFVAFEYCCFIWM